VGMTATVAAVLAEAPRPDAVQCVANALDMTGDRWAYDDRARPDNAAVRAAAVAAGVPVIGIRAVAAGSLDRRARPRRRPPATRQPATLRPPPAPSARCGTRRDRRVPGPPLRPVAAGRRDGRARGQGPYRAGGVPRRGVRGPARAGRARRGPYAARVIRLLVAAQGGGDLATGRLPQRAPRVVRGFAVEITR
jgi:hypothetical protein